MLGSTLLYVDNISILFFCVNQSKSFFVRFQNGTFLAPTLSIPMMMFAGFGVTLRDIPGYMKWGTYISYMRYGLEGYVGAIYGDDRALLACDEAPYCHYRYPNKFLSEITMRGDQFWYDLIALMIIFVVFRLGAYLVLRWKVISVR